MPLGQKPSGRGSVARTRERLSAPRTWAERIVPRLDSSGVVGDGVSIVSLTWWPANPRDLGLGQDQPIKWLLTGVGPHPRPPGIGDLGDFLADDVASPVQSQLRPGRRRSCVAETSMCMMPSVMNGTSCPSGWMPCGRSSVAKHHHPGHKPRVPVSWTALASCRSGPRSTERILNWQGPRLQGHRNPFRRLIPQ